MPWQRNGKILITLASILIGFLLVALLKNPVGSTTIRPEGTISDLIQIEQENQQLAAENAKLQAELAKYRTGQNASDLAVKQTREARMNAGLVAVRGPGIRIILDDSDVSQLPPGEDINNYLIHEAYIRDIMNALWNGGAEAISVNGQRVTTHTEVFCSGSYIQIAGTRQMPPYTIDAIGDTYNLQSALNFYVWNKLGDFQEQYGITRTLETKDDMVIPAGKLKAYKYAEPIKEGT